VKTTDEKGFYWKRGNFEKTLTKNIKGGFSYVKKKRRKRLYIN
jgi:hypothetical protein